MDSSKFWYLGLAPGTPADEMQAKIEACLAAEETTAIPLTVEDHEDGSDKPTE